MTTRIYMSCQDRSHRDRWYVTQRNCNFSAFNGYRYTPSDYSRVRCPIDGLTWRTKAAYVETLPDAPDRWWDEDVRDLVGYEAKLHKMKFQELLDEAHRVNAQIFPDITRPILIGRILERQGIDDSILAHPDQEEKS